MKEENLKRWFNQGEILTIMIFVSSCIFQYLFKKYFYIDNAGIIFCLSFIFFIFFLFIKMWRHKNA